MKVLIVDDHAVVRAGLKQILAEGSEPLQIREAGDAATALALVRQERPDIVLLDVRLPDGNGIEVLKHLRAQHRDLPVLMLSMYPEDQYAVRALRAGACGYMTKESAPEELLTAITKVVRGGRYIGPAVAELLACGIDADSDRLPHEGLSDREFQVLRLIASGRTVSEIAETLNLSVKTISTYRTRVLEKMQLKHNAELTHYAVTHGLID